MVELPSMQCAPPQAAMNEPIGVFGGTFDPIHYGHLIVAERAREELGLARVILVPAGRPPHKLLEPMAGGEDRYRMVTLAAASNPHLVVSRCEIEREGPCYTIDTIRELRAQYDREICLMIGADSALEMPTWRGPEEILRESEVVALRRPGFELSQMAELLGDDQAKRVRVLDTPLIDISSTEIRERVAGGRSIRYLVPEAVEAYIHERRLYSKWQEDSS